MLASGAPKPKPALYDPAELDEDVDLERDHRQKILDTYYRLGDLNLYEVLDVPRTADKKAVKRAYYDLASVHHPDRFFRKRLGTFKQKMEAVFSRVTEAHDTLTDKDRRAEYDGYLERAGRGARPRSADGAACVVARHGSHREAARRPRRRSSRLPRSRRLRRPSGRRASSSPSKRVVMRSRGRLLGGRTGPRRACRASRRPRRPQPAADPDALRRHYEQKITAVREHMSKEHIATAEQAVAAGDWVGATNSYRLALQVNPDDANLQRALAEAQVKANAVLAEAYRKQAIYEEKSLKTAEAARSWQRVTKVLPDDADAHARAATCMLEEEIELRTAATLAQRAVDARAEKRQISAHPRRDLPRGRPCVEREARARSSCTARARRC